MEAAMPCKLKTTKSSCRHRETDCGSNKIQQNKHGVHASWRLMNRRESVWNLLERSRRSHCGEGVQLVESSPSCAQVRSCAPSDENPACKSSSGQGMGKGRKVAGVAIDHGKEQKRGPRRGTEGANNSPLCHADRYVSSQQRRVGTKVSKVLRGDFVKDDSGSHVVSTEQGSSVSQMTAAKVMDVFVRLPDCAGQAADAVSAYTQVKIMPSPTPVSREEGLGLGLLYPLPKLETSLGFGFALSLPPPLPPNMKNEKRFLKQNTNKNKKKFFLKKIKKLTRNRHN